MASPNDRKNEKAPFCFLAFHSYCAHLVMLMFSIECGLFHLSLFALMWTAPEKNPAEVFIGFVVCSNGKLWMFHLQKKSQEKKKAIKMLLLFWILLSGSLSPIWFLCYLLPDLSWNSNFIFSVLVFCKVVLFFFCLEPTQINQSRSNKQMKNITFFEEFGFARRTLQSHPI